MKKGWEKNVDDSWTKHRGSRKVEIHKVGMKWKVELIEDGKVKFDYEFDSETFAFNTGRRWLAGAGEGD